MRGRAHHQTLGIAIAVLVAACDRGPSAAALDRLQAEAVAANAAARERYAADDASAPGRSLTVLGQVATPSTLDWAALDGLATEHVRTKNPQNPGDRGRVVDFRGVLVKDVLDRAGADPAADEITFVALDAFRSTVAAADLRRYRVLLAIAADGAPIDRSSGGPIFLVFPHTETPETERLFPDRFWSFYVSHVIVGTARPRLLVAGTALDADALAKLPTTVLDAPVGWKTQWPSGAVHLRGVALTEVLRAAGATVPPGGRVIVRGLAAGQRDPAHPIAIAADDVATCGLMLASRWGVDEAPITARRGGPLALAVPPACAERLGEKAWVTFVEELVIEPPAGAAP
jgi:hypothetical protein